MRPSRSAPRPDTNDINVCPLGASGLKTASIDEHTCCITSVRKLAHILVSDRRKPVFSSVCACEESRIDTPSDDCVIVSSRSEYHRGGSCDVPSSPTHPLSGFLWQCSVVWSLFNSVALSDLSRTKHSVDSIPLFNNSDGRPVAIDVRSP